MEEVTVYIFRMVIFLLEDIFEENWSLSSRLLEILKAWFSPLALSMKTAADDNLCNSWFQGIIMHDISNWIVLNCLPTDFHMKYQVLLVY